MFARVLVAAWLVATCSIAAAAEPRISFSSATTIREFNDLAYYEVTYSLPLPASGRGWGPDELRFSGGVFRRDSEQGNIFSFGPAWRRDIGGGRCRCFLGAGIVVAWLDRPRFHDPVTNDVENFGNELQFITHVAFGWEIDRSWALAFNLQHISNGGLSEINPGAEFFGLEVQYGY